MRKFEPTPSWTHQHWQRLEKRIARSCEKAQSQIDKIERISAIHQEHIFRMRTLLENGKPLGGNRN